MRMVFAGSGADGYERARQELVDRFTRWAGRRGLDVDASVVAASADYKVEADGLLGRWTVGALRTLLTEWFPRRVALPADHHSAVLPALHAWIDFLADQSLLDSRSTDSTTLHGALDDLAAEFDAAMADPRGDGLAAAAEASPVVRRLRALLAWVGEGRPLTAAGRFTLAEAAELVELLGTGDRVAPVVGSRVYQVTSSRHAHGLEVTFQWAKAARLARVVKGRLVPVKRAAPALADPLALWQRAFAAFGLLADTVCGGLPGDSPVRWRFADTVRAALLAVYAQRGAVPLVLLDELAWEVSSGLARYGVDGRMRESASRDLRRAFDQLELLGAVRLRACTDRAELAQLAELCGRPVGADPMLVELTPLGMWGVRQVTREAAVLGADRPLPAAGLAEETAEVMLAAVADRSEREVDAEISAWCAARGDDRAAAELCELIARTSDPRHRMLALHALARTGRPGVTAARMLRRHTDVGPLAAVWLVEQGIAEPDSISPAEARFALVETLAAMAMIGPHAVVQALGEHLGPDQLAFVDQIHQVDHPLLPVVLDALAAHPDREVARSAARARRAWPGRDR